MTANEMSPDAATDEPAVDTHVSGDALDEAAAVERMHAHALDVVVRSADRGMALDVAAELIRRAYDVAVLHLRAIAHREELDPPVMRAANETVPQQFPGYLVGVDFTDPARPDWRHVDYSYSSRDEAEAFLIGTRLATRPDLPWRLYGLVALETSNTSPSGANVTAEGAGPAAGMQGPAAAAEFGGDPRW